MIDIEKLLETRVDKRIGHVVGGSVNERQLALDKAL